MKKIFAVMMSIMLAFSMAGCSSSDSKDSSTDDAGKASTETSGSKEKVKLNFWVFGSTGYEPLVKEYMEANPNVEIKLNFTEMNDLHNNLFTSISAGSGAPDISMVEVSQVARFMEAKDAFNNLKDLGADQVKGNYLEWKWKQATTPDDSFMIGLPTDIGPTVMYYRSDVFKEAGLPTDPAEVAKLAPTWDAFYEVAKTIKDKTGKVIVDGPELLFSALRDQAPEQYFNEKDELILESSPYTKKAYDYTAKLIQEGLVGKNGLWTPEWGAAMGKGSYGTLLAPSWMVAVIKGNAKDASGKWGITTMPEGAGNWGGSFLTIPKESKNPEEAYKFIQWLTAPEQQLKSFKEAGLFPSTQEVYTDTDFLAATDEYFSGAKTAEIFSTAAQKVEPVYMGKNYATAHTELINALMNVATKKADPDKEWKSAIAKIKKQLERK